MNSMTNFYDNLDLKYPEIGIAIQDINRLNPGKVKMIIPILTPNMDNTKAIEKVAYQNSSNLMNAKKNVNIQNIKITNYIEIPFPSEICTVSEYDTDRFTIEAGSKWIIVFVGGDITKPRPIARYID